MPRSSVLYRAKAQRSLEQLTRLIQANLVTFPYAGYRWMYVLLKRQRVASTRSEVRRVYVDLNILGKRAPPKMRTTDSRHEHERYPNLVRDLTPERPDQVWVADTLEFRIKRRRAFLALIEDVYTRRVVGFAISFANDSLLTKEALAMALLGGTPEIHHSDQGKTYAAGDYVDLLPETVRISMAAAGRAWENGFAERLNRTFREQEISRSEYESLEEARSSIQAYVKLYNEERIHESLKRTTNEGVIYLTPAEVYQAYKAAQPVWGTTPL